MHGRSILGNAISITDEGSFHAFNPATGERLEPAFFDAGEIDIRDATGLASSAFDDYRTIDKDARAAFLDRIGDEIIALGEELLLRANLETGLPLERLTGERGRTVNQLKMFSALIREGSWVEASIDRAQPDRQPVPKPDLRRMLIPIGPVAVFGASNFPLAFSVAGGDTASALAAGCPVIVKAHPAHPGTSELVAGAIIKAAQASGMPEGVFSMLQGASHETGLRLVTDSRIRAVGFTGSFRGGKALYDAAVGRAEPIPVYSEMGSVNPVFVLPGVLRERGEAFAEGLKNSITMGVGQFCTCPGLLFGLKGMELDQAITKLSSLVRESTAGTMLHSGIRQAFDDGVGKLSRISGVVTERSRTVVSSSGSQAGAVVFITDCATFLAKPALAEEVFGPSTVVVGCETRDELEKAARSLSGHLTATIQGTAKDLGEFAWLVKILEQKVGRLLINGFPTGVEVCPSMVHGGPYPATTDSRTTSVGTDAIKRFVRPVCYQGFPQELLPSELKDGNPAVIWRRIDGEFVKS